MKRKTYIKLWVSVQVILFILPLILGTIDASISYKKIPYYLKELERNREVIQNSKLTDFAESKLTPVEYSQKVGEYKWALEHPIMFYFNEAGVAFAASLLSQIFNLFWFMIYKENEFDWEDEN